MSTNNRVRPGDVFEVMDRGVEVIDSAIDKLEQASIGESITDEAADVVNAYQEFVSKYEDFKESRSA